MKKGRFAWKALDAKGVIKYGSYVGDEITDIQKRLRQEGYYPVKIYPSRDWLGTYTLSPVKFQWGNFARRLTTLLEAGIPLVQALEIMSLQEGKSPSQQVLWKGIKQRVEAGHDLSEALSFLQPSPAPFVLSMIKAGEYTGTLGKVLGEVADELEQEQLYRQKLIGALAYPMLLFLTMIIVLSVLAIWVIPIYQNFFTGMDADLPFLTQFIFSVGRKIPILLGCGCIFGAGSWFVIRFTKPDYGKILLERFLLQLPFIGNIYRARDLLLFSRILECLLSAGIPLLEALRLLAGTLRRLEMIELTKRLIQTVREGKRMAPLLRSSRVFPKEAAEMIAVAEETGQLDRMLHSVTKMFQRELEGQLNRLARVIEPALIMAFSGLIGLVAAAVMLPIFDLGSHIR